MLTLWQGKVGGFVYHSRFTGNHYESGVKYGSLLYNKGIDLNSSIELTKENIKFTKECLKSYLRYYPQVLDEIKGIAAGLRMSYLNLAVFLFSTYCFKDDNKCTCFAFKDKDNIILGRNSEYRVKPKSIYESTYYNLEEGFTFIGNTTSMVQVEDGINEYGLACGLACVSSSIVQPGINPGMLVRMVLETCKTTKEAVEKLKEVKVASSQTLTIADKQGDLVVVECNPKNIALIKPQNGEPFVIATNKFRSELMNQYEHDENGCVYEQERYDTVKDALMNEQQYSVRFAKNLLSGKCGFISQYNKKIGFDTIWSTVYDLKELRVYRAEGNPIRKKYQEDTRLKFVK